jgi:hypothetical protein
MSTPPPRHYLRVAPAPAAQPGMGWMLQGVGMPQDRLARMAARRGFVEAKQRFMAAVADVPGSRGDWLRHQVRQTQEPVDLWLLRGAVFAAVRGLSAEAHQTRLDLHRALDSVFPDSGELTPFMPLY